MAKDILGRPMVKVEIVDDNGMVRTIQGPAEDFNLDINGNSGEIKLNCRWGPGFDTTYAQTIVVPDESKG